MFTTLEVTGAAAVTRLATVAQVRSDLSLAESKIDDAYLGRVIDFCSEEIATYLRRGVDEEEKITLGRETIRETFYNFSRFDRIILGRRPVGAIISIKEGGGAAILRVIGNTDGAISSGGTTFVSAGGPGSGDFTNSYVGKAITIAGAGASGADLTTTVAGVTSATEIELTDAAATTVSDATYTVENPAFAYIVRKQRGEIIKRSGLSGVPFYSEPLTIVYTAGWLLPGETGRNLPAAIEQACVLYCRKKIDQLQEGEDFSGTLQESSIDGVGSFKFSSSYGLEKGFGLPLEVRAVLDRYFEPVMA